MFEIELTICIKIDLALNNPQRLIRHKTQPTKPNQCWNLDVLDFSLIFNSLSPFCKELGTVPSAPTTIGITVTLIFHSFFSSLIFVCPLPFFRFYFVVGRNGKIHLFYCILFYFILFVNQLLVWSSGPKEFGNLFESQNPG